MLIRLLTSTVNSSNHTKCISLNNQQYIARPTLISLHPNEYSQVLHYYLFVFNLGRCTGSCNTLKDLSNKILCCKQNRRFRSKRIQHDKRNKKSKTLAKQISYKCECKFDRINVQVKSGITINVDVSVKIRKNIMCAKNIIVRILLYVVAKMANI